MSFLAQFNDERRTMADALLSASSPHRWKQIIAPRIKAALEVGYCFKWIKQLEINPGIHSGLLIGSTLNDLLSDNEGKDKSAVDLEKPMSQPAQFHPVFDALKSRKNKSVETHVRKKTELFTNSETKDFSRSDCDVKTDPETIQSDQIRQVYTQQKTASVTSLQQWTNDASEQGKKVVKGNDKKLPLAGENSPRAPVKSINKKQNKYPAPQVLGKNKHQVRWHRQINRQIIKVLGCMNPKETGFKNKNASVLTNLTESDMSVWDRQLCQDSESSKRISIETLSAMQKPIYGEIQYESTTVERHFSNRKNEIETLSISERNIDTSSSSARNKELSLQQQLLNKEKSRQQIQNNSLSIPKAEETSPATNYERAKLKPIANKSANNQVEDAKKQETERYFPATETPEFPPVRKNIIEELQPSGKRTALKSEAKNATQMPIYLDEDELAETLKRIIDEQARRQGINV